MCDLSITMGLERFYLARSFAIGSVSKRHSQK